jgi:hypothetical protein
MEQSEKMIANRKFDLDDIEKINIGVIARGDYPIAYRNIGRSIERHFGIALLRWRRGESPVADMEAALATSREMFAAISDWQLDDETLNGYGDIWNLVRYIGLLLGRKVELPKERLPRIREDRSQYADVALDYRILDALEGRGWREGVTDLLGRLASKKRQMLAVETYQTYFALLESDGTQERTEALVRAAEANYKNRGRDGFYGGGPTYMGGGPDNPYVVDFVLAAILKHINWTGDSIHKWVW